jgi:formate hydrogenlyase transcriptional activator
MRRRLRRVQLFSRPRGRPRTRFIVSRNDNSGRNPGYNTRMTPESPDAGALRRYEALLGVLESITRHGDLTELFHDLARRLRLVVPFDFITVLLHDPAEDVMRLHIMESEEPDHVRLGPNTTPVESPGGQVWQTQLPLVIADYELETNFPRLIPVWRGFGMRSGYYLPLTTAQRRLGTINFASRQPRSYDARDLHLFQQVARAAAVAVDNALNFQQAQTYQRTLAEERDRLRLLLEVNNAVVSHLDLRDLFRPIAASLRRVLQQDYASLALYDKGRHSWRVHALDFPRGKGLVRAEYEAPFEGAPASASAAARRPVVFDRGALERLNSAVARALLAEGLRWLCCVPLLSGRRTLAALNVGRFKETSFTESEVGLLGQVGGQIALAVENALAYRQIADLKNKLADEKNYLEDEIRTEHNPTEIIGTSRGLQEVLKQVRIVAPSDSTVLIQGETGTGKELIARAIHDLSRRRERTFVKLNCAAIPSGLLESELFGHERGAFTGAVSQKVGRFELAHQGTLFLDEVGDIPPELQPKLLRVLQEQEFERLGSTKTQRVDVRLVAATNRDLTQMVAEGRFRNDLYYRLHVFPLTLPPLRDRPEDVPPLVRHFVAQHARRLNKRIDVVSAEAMAALTGYPWPGNVRELSNFIERSVLLSPGNELRVAVGDLKPLAAPEADGAATLAEAEREHILAVLRETKWRVGGPSGAAERLGLKRTTLQSKMRKLGIARPG